MRLTRRGYRVVALFALVGFLAINGVAGWIEGGM
jgi:hypothetical protein